MQGKQTEMNHVRNILRLKAQGASDQLTGCCVGLEWPLDEMPSDEAVAALLFIQPSKGAMRGVRRKPEPDWAAIPDAIGAGAIDPRADRGSGARAAIRPRASLRPPQRPLASRRWSAPGASRRETVLAVHSRRDPGHRHNRHETNLPHQP
jgi:hypothetical protein